MKDKEICILRSEEISNFSDEEFDIWIDSVKPPKYTLMVPSLRSLIRQGFSGMRIRKMFKKLGKRLEKTEKSKKDNTAGRYVKGKWHMARASSYARRAAESTVDLFSPDLRPIEMWIPEAIEYLNNPDLIGGSEALSDFSEMVVLYAGGMGVTLLFRAVRGYSQGMTNLSDYITMLTDTLSNLDAMIRKLYQVYQDGIYHTARYTDTIHQFIRELLEDPTSLDNLQVTLENVYNLEKFNIETYITDPASRMIYLELKSDIRKAVKSLNLDLEWVTDARATEKELFNFFKGVLDGFKVGGDRAYKVYTSTYQQVEGVLQKFQALASIPEQAQDIAETIFSRPSTSPDMFWWPIPQLLEAGKPNVESNLEVLKERNKAIPSQGTPGTNPLPRIRVSK